MTDQAVNLGNRLAVNKSTFSDASGVLEVGGSYTPGASDARAVYISGTLKPGVGFDSFGLYIASTVDTGNNPTAHFGVYSHPQGSGGGAVLSMYGYYAEAVTGGSQNNYGVYIARPHGGGTENYALKALGSSAFANTATNETPLFLDAVAGSTAHGLAYRVNSVVKAGISSGGIPFSDAGGLRMLKETDPTGPSNYVTLTGITDQAARGVGVGQILFNDGSNRNCTGFLKFYYEGTAHYIPFFDHA